jgi:hypothetical protein
MRFENKLLEEMKQDKVDKILLKSAARQVLRVLQTQIDNYISNIEIERKDVKKKKQFAFDEILKNLSKMKGDIY